MTPVGQCPRCGKIGTSPGRMFGMVEAYCWTCSDELNAKYHLVVVYNPHPSLLPKPSVMETPV